MSESRPKLSLIAFDNVHRGKIIDSGEDPTYWRKGPHPVRINVIWQGIYEPDRHAVGEGFDTYQLSDNTVWSGSYHHDDGKWKVNPIIDLTKEDAASGLDDQVSTFIQTKGAKYLIFAEQDEHITDPRVVFTPQMIRAKISSLQDAHAGAHTKYPDRYPKPQAGDWRIAANISSGIEIITVPHHNTLYVAL